MLVSKSNKVGMDVVDCIFGAQKIGQASENETRTFLKVDGLWNLTSFLEQGISSKHRKPFR